MQQARQVRLNSHELLQWKMDLFSFDRTRVAVGLGGAALFLRAGGDLPASAVRPRISTWLESSRNQGLGVIPERGDRGEKVKIDFKFWNQPSSASATMKSAFII